MKRLILLALLFFAVQAAASAQYTGPTRGLRVFGPNGDGSTHRLTLTGDSVTSAVTLHAGTVHGTVQTKEAVAADLGSTFQPLDSDLTYLAGVTLAANVKTILEAANYAAIRTALSLVPGTDVQAYDADLAYLAGFTPSANVKSILNAADYSAIRTLLGLVIGTNVQAYDADLTTYAGITPSANVQTLLGSASFAAFNTNLGLGTGDAVQHLRGGFGVAADATAQITAKSATDTGTNDVLLLKNNAGNKLFEFANYSGGMLFDLFNNGTQLSRFYNTYNWFAQPLAVGQSSAPSGSYKFEVTGTSHYTGAGTWDLGEVIVDGQYLSWSSNSSSIVANSGTLYINGKVGSAGEMNFRPQQGSTTNQTAVSTTGIWTFPGRTHFTRTIDPRNIIRPKALHDDGTLVVVLYVNKSGGTATISNLHVESTLNGAVGVLNEATGTAYSTGLSTVQSFNCDTAGTSIYYHDYATPTDASIANGNKVIYTFDATSDPSNVTIWFEVNE